MNSEEIMKLEELEQKKKFLKETIEKFEYSVEDLTYWNIDTEELESSIEVLKTELKDTETEIDEIENSENYEEQLEYQQKEYRKMQGF